MSWIYSLAIVVLITVSVSEGANLTDIKWFTKANSHKALLQEALHSRFIYLPKIDVIDEKSKKNEFLLKNNKIKVMQKSLWEMSSMACIPKITLKNQSCIKMVKIRIFL